MNNLKRHSSICPDPKEALLSAVFENRQDDIENIFMYNEEILNERYNEKYFKPILFIALKEGAKKVRPETIDCLIKLGASLKCNPNDTTHSYYEAIHFASLGLNPSLLERIIEHYKNKGLDLNRASKYGGTALYVLIKDGDSLNENFERCVEILLKSGIDYNKTDQNGTPPVYWAAKKRYEMIVRKLLEYPDVNIDYTSRNKSTRDLIRELGIEIPVLEIRVNNNLVFDELLSYVKESRQNDFIELGTGVLDFNSVDLDEKTFLQYACEKNLLEVVEFLLRKGVDVNKTTEKHLSPIEIAADHGYYLILKALLSKDEILLKNALLRIMPKLEYEQRENVDYLKCFNILIDSGKELNVNQKDKSGNYPLHYAARYGGQEVALKLLNKSASLGNRNAFNYLSIHDINYNTLKQHFDGCIEAVPNNGLDSESISITFDYKTLLPTKDESIRINLDEEENLRRQHRATPETDVLFFLSKSSELKTLLKHPLITSFLYVKWYRIRWIFYTNLFFYLTFLLSLLLYIFAYYKEGRDSRNAFLYVFLFLTTLVLFVREVFQIIVGPLKYFTNFENFIEIMLIAVVSFMLFARDSSAGVRTQAAAIAFLLAAFELLFLLGNYPGLSTNIVMLRTVSYNFFKFLLFYSILIIAFAFCFHTLFNNQNLNATSRNATNEEDDGEDKFFVNPVISMFKTMVMLTGEFEAGEIKFEKYPVTSHLIFLAFVVTVAIILLNLLNGLAVSDTQEIKNEAELVGHIARAEYITYAESMLFSSLIPHKITSLYRELFPCRNPGGFKKNPYKPLAEKICIHPEYLSGYKLIIFPNQNGRVHFENANPGVCRNLYLDKATVRRARDLLHEKRESAKEELEQKRLNDMQEEMLKKITFIERYISAQKD